MPVQGPPADNTVAANVLHRALRAAVEHGGADRRSLLAAVHVDEAKLRHPLGRLPAQVFVRLLLAIERELGDPMAALRLSFVSGPSCFSDIGFIGRYAGTLGEAMETQVRNQELRQSMARLELDRNSSPARLKWNVPHDLATDLGPAIEATVGAYIQIGREICGTAPCYRRITLQHEPRFAPDIYEQALGHPVEFGCAVTSIEFHDGALHHPTLRADPRLIDQGLANFNKSAAWMAEGKECSGNGYFYLSAELNKSPLTLERMASAFGMTERTLRRRLDSEGKPFRALLDEVRRDMDMLYRMEGRRSLGEIALLLGYAELSAFTRAHKRWYGEPPSLRRAA